MPSFLGHYQNAATDRPRKLQRAIQSFIDQPYPDKELVIVSDGCKETMAIYRKLKQAGNWPEGLTQFIYVAKQDQFSGMLRNVGIKHATGDIISYLDNDDKLFGNHLGQIMEAFKGPGITDWVYFNDYEAKDAVLTMRERETKLSFGRIGTSAIAHRRTIDVSWKNGYGHDWDLILQLTDKYPHNKKVTAAGYLVCHVPCGIDY